MNVQAPKAELVKAHSPGFDFTMQRFDPVRTYQEFESNSARQLGCSRLFSAQLCWQFSPSISRDF